MQREHLRINNTNTVYKMQNSRNPKKPPIQTYLICKLKAGTMPGVLQRPFQLRLPEILLGNWQKQVMNK